MNRLKKKYVLVDVLYLIILFLFLLIFKDYIFGNKMTDRNAIYFCTLLSIGCISLYFFKKKYIPDYEDVIKFYKRGWRISGYYSKKSLENKENYIKSYKYWISFNIRYLIVEFIIIYFMGKGDVNTFNIHLCIVFAIQILSYFATRFRERKI